MVVKTSADGSTALDTHGLWVDYDSPDRTFFTYCEVAQKMAREL